MKQFLHIINLGSSAMNFIGDQFSYMNHQGNFEMHLICTPCDGIEEFVKEQRVHYFPLTIERQIRILKDIRALWKIYRYIRRNHIDIIVGHQAKGTLLAMTAGWLARIPHRVILVHGMLTDTMVGNKKRIFISESKILSRIAHKIVCVSPSVARRRIEQHIDKKEKQVILGKGTCNGIDTIHCFNPNNISTIVIKDLKEQYGINKNDIVIGFVGRIVRDKGIIELSEAFQKISKSHPELHFKLFIIGPIEKRNTVPDETLGFLKSTSSVIFSGHIPHQNIQKYYSLMDMLILPSYREGFPTVVLEASAMEIPVIVSRSTGCIDSIVEGKTGIYCDIEPSSIANSIEKLLDKEYAKLLGKQGRQWVIENFEHTTVRQYYYTFYEELLRK